MDRQKGLVCKLTGEKAQFENTCEDFQLDESVKEEEINEQYEQKPSVTELIAKLSKEDKEILSQHQDPVYALVGGFFLAIIGALLWALVTVATGYQIGYMAIGVGFIVGMGVRYFGAGIEQYFGYIGGGFALFGCLLGNLLSQIGFIADSEGYSYMQVISLLDFSIVMELYKETFSIMDLLFYGLAVVEGYKFAFRPIPNTIDEAHHAPAYANLRLPIVIACFIIISISGFVLSKGFSGEQVFHYESGAVQSIGNMENNEQQGIWTYYYETGEKQLEGEFINGLEEGEWNWFYQNGVKSKTITYKKGLPHGKSTTYYEDGTLSDSANYESGRLEGPFTLFFPDGSIAEKGSYKRGKLDGENIVYFENGQKSVESTYKNGSIKGLWKSWNEKGMLLQELEYIDKDAFNIVNVWDKQGNPIVRNGEGYYKSFFEDGTLSDEGKVQNGQRIGIWKTYYPNGKLMEEGTYVDRIFKLNNSFFEDGSEHIKSGNGYYTIHFDNSDVTYMEGEYKDGYKHGVWKTYYQSGVIANVINYENGKNHGHATTYFENGNVQTEGDFINNAKEGKWSWYYENGTLESTVSYSKDKKTGTQVLYTELGQEAKEEYYENGVFKGEKFIN